jgi:hypothetical protein
VLKTRVFRLTRFVALASIALALAVPVGAQTLPPVSIGAGLRSSFVHTEPDGPADGTDEFLLDSVRLYVNGSVTNKIKIMFNTEYNGSQNDVEVLDAAGQFAFSPEVQRLVRAVPAAERSRQPVRAVLRPPLGRLYRRRSGRLSVHLPGSRQRAMYWGQFGKVKVSGGAFDGRTLTETTRSWALPVCRSISGRRGGRLLPERHLLRRQEPLAIGGAGQVQGEDKSAYSVDFLMERKLPGGAAPRLRRSGRNMTGWAATAGAMGPTTADTCLGAYLFPRMSGPGQWELLGKFGKARFREGLTLLDLDYDQKTTEVDFNYVLKQFNARVMIFYLDTRFDAVRTNFKKFGVGLQLQM